MKYPDPSGVSLSIVCVAALAAAYLAGAGCAPMPKIPDPLTPLVQSVEITQAPPPMLNGGAPGSGQYKVVLKQVAHAGQSLTVKIFEDDEIWDERIVETKVTFDAGSTEHSGSFELACDANGSMVGSTYHDEDGEYEVYALVTDGIGDTAEESAATRIRCVPR